MFAAFILHYPTPFLKIQFRFITTLEFFNHSCLTFEHYVVAAEITRQLNLFTPLIRIISSVLNIRYQRYISWQNYILDIG